MAFCGYSLLGNPYVFLRLRESFLMSMISIFDLFSIGVGPSSSHTVGPMRAAHHFVEQILLHQHMPKVTRVMVELYGSLALTGIGHATDRAVLLGLEGYLPADVPMDAVHTRPVNILQQQKLHLRQEKWLGFSPKTDLLFHKTKRLPYHSNGMVFSAFDTTGSLLLSATYFSIGGGFIVDAHGEPLDNQSQSSSPVPHIFRSAKELHLHCQRLGGLPADVMLANECHSQSEDIVREKLLNLWHVMEDCIERGLHTTGILPGGLNVRRRAPALYQELLHAKGDDEPIGAMDYLSVYAIAVNEENAAGGRVVTAPTNGAAGVIPAVLYYYAKHHKKPTEEGIIRFLLTAGAIGMLYKYGASISAAEVGCQGEVGVACSMAAGAYAAVLGGNAAQIENAAEMGMEHNLGLTCDPIGGLVQIPCIERNAMGAVQAVNCGRLALKEQGTNLISLDQVIRTMLATGKDMRSKYKETAKGGLAVSQPEC